VADSPAESRRGFLKAATIAIGSTLGVVLAIPLVRMALFPLGRKVVAAGAEPIDVGAADAVPSTGPPLISVACPPSLVPRPRRGV